MFLICIFNTCKREQRRQTVYGRLYYILIVCLGSLEFRIAFIPTLYFKKKEKKKIYIYIYILTKKYYIYIYIYLRYLAETIILSFVLIRIL